MSLQAFKTVQYTLTTISMCINEFSVVKTKLEFTEFSNIDTTGKCPVKTKERV